jgi:hypothetical protein
MILLLNLITYFAIAGAIATLGALGDASDAAALGTLLIVGTCLVLFMPPLAWIADMLPTGNSKSVAMAPPGEDKRITEA